VNRSEIRKLLEAMKEDPELANKVLKTAAPLDDNQFFRDKLGKWFRFRVKLVGLSLLFLVLFFGGVLVIPHIAGDLWMLGILAWAIGLGIASWLFYEYFLATQLWRHRRDLKELYDHFTKGV